MFPKQVYQKRRNELMKKVEGGIIILPGHQESSINFKHNYYHFRQDSNFLYYVGISKPELVLVIDVDNDEACLFGNDLSIDDIIWTGPMPTVSELATLSGIKHSRTLNDVGSTVQSAIKSGRAIHYCPPYREEHYANITHWTGWNRALIDQKISIKLIRAIVTQRSYKEPEEVVEIERAVNITGNMHLSAMQMVREGMRESEVTGKINGIAVAGGGHLSFPIILTKDGQTLHNHYHGNILKNGDMVLCDAGAETEMGYAGDMTRTFPVADQFTTQQKEVYDCVYNAHMTAVEALKPGTRFIDVHLLACKKLVEGLNQIGLMKGDPEEAVNAGAHTMFFQCGLGHMMGLDVHDMENLGEQYVGYTDDFEKPTEFGLKSLRLGRALEEGVVLTVEPGIYIIPQLIDLWQKDHKHANFIDYKTLSQFKSFGGIRVEEDFLITDNGARLLGDEVPKSSDAIESVRKTCLNF